MNEINRFGEKKPSNRALSLCVVLVVIGLKKNRLYVRR